MALKKVPQRSGEKPKHPLSALVDVGEPLDINMALDYLIGNFVRLSSLEEDRRQAAVYLINKIREFAELQEEETKEQCPDTADTEATEGDLRITREELAGLRTTWMAFWGLQTLLDNREDGLGELLEAITEPMSRVMSKLEKGGAK